jgi:mRNA-degrading endonuclease RelE of RelBE toxin-antitoxin system
MSARLPNAPFTIQLSKAAEQQLRDLNHETQQPLLVALMRLRDMGEGDIAYLKGNLAGYLRLRVGQFRVVFTLEKRVLIIDRIGNRKDVYE